MTKFVQTDQGNDINCKRCSKTKVNTYRTSCFSFNKLWSKQDDTDLL